MWTEIKEVWNWSDLEQSVSYSPHTHARSYIHIHAHHWYKHIHKNEIKLNEKCLYQAELGLLSPHFYSTLKESYISCIMLNHTLNTCYTNDVLSYLMTHHNLQWHCYNIVPRSYVASCYCCSVQYIEWVMFMYCIILWCDMLK